MKISNKFELKFKLSKKKNVCDNFSLIVLVFITDKTQNYVSSWTGAILKNLEEMHDRQVKFDDTFINIKPEEDESQVDECNFSFFFIFAK